MSMYKWREFKGSEDYSCNCHCGTCFVHGDRVENPARDLFLKALTEALGITPHAENGEDYSSPKRNLARKILHQADYYVSQVLRQQEDALSTVENNETYLHRPRL